MVDTFKDRRRYREVQVILTVQSQIQRNLLFQVTHMTVR